MRPLPNLWRFRPLTPFGVTIEWLCKLQTDDSVLATVLGFPKTGI